VPPNYELIGAHPLFPTHTRLRMTRTSQADNLTLGESLESDWPPNVVLRSAGTAVGEVTLGELHEVGDPIKASGKPDSHGLDDPSLRRSRSGDPLRGS